MKKGGEQPIKWNLERKMKIIGIVKGWIDKKIFRIKLSEMDSLWYYSGASGWKLFPPSFYYTHTEEEIERITAEINARLQELIDQLED